MQWIAEFILVVNIALFMYKGAQSLMNKKALLQICTSHYRFWINNEACSVSETGIINEAH